MIEVVIEGVQHRFQIGVGHTIGVKPLCHDTARVQTALGQLDKFIGEQVGNTANPWI